jgi:hypothetical protein
MKPKRKLLCAGEAEARHRGRYGGQAVSRRYDIDDPRMSADARKLLRAALALFVEETTAGKTGRF